MLRLTPAQLRWLYVAVSNGGRVVAGGKARQTPTILAARRLEEKGYLTPVTELAADGQTYAVTEAGIARVCKNAIPPYRKVVAHGVELRLPWEVMASMRPENAPMVESAIRVKAGVADRLSAHFRAPTSRRAWKMNRTQRREALRDIGGDATAIADRVCADLLSAVEKHLSKRKECNAQNIRNHQG